MKRTLIPLALLAALAATPSHAADFQEQIDTLNKQLMDLRDQVVLLRSMLNRDIAGNVTVMATVNRKDLVGADFSTSVGGNATSSFGRSLTLAVAQSRSTQIGVDDVLTVSGASTTTVNGRWRLNVGGDAISTFARSQAQSVGQSRTTQISVNDALTVTGSSTSTIGGNWTHSVNGSANQQVANNLSVSAAKAILLQAGDQITLKSGDSTLVMKKDGTITINGKLVTIGATGDIVLKGARIQQN